MIDNLSQEHIRNIESLVREFGEKHRDDIIARYSHQFHISDEDPALANGKLSKHVYNRTKEALKLEYRDS